jgi:hypothetical protein
MLSILPFDGPFAAVKKLGIVIEYSVYYPIANLFHCSFSLFYGIKKSQHVLKTFYQIALDGQFCMMSDNERKLRAALLAERGCIGNRAER